MEKRRRANSSERQRDRCSSIDRISLLPDELLASILSHLSLKEATASSLLCRRWRYMWTLTSKLHFDGIDSLLKVKMGDSNRDLVLVKERSKYIKWVDNVIALYDQMSNSTIEEFKIFFNLNESNGKSIDRWVRYALDRKVHRLELNLTNDASWRWPRHDHYTFPYNLMPTDKNTSSSDFKFLKTMSLNNVRVKGETLEAFLSGCPLLEEMSVTDSTDLLSLNLIGPSSQLKRLAISDCRNLKSVEIRDANIVYLKYKGRTIPFVLENVPLLVELYVGEVVDHCTKDDVSMFSSVFPQLERCTIDLETLYLSWRKSRLLYSRVKMCKLKQLVVQVYINGRGYSDLLLLTKLTSAAPCLQRLVLVISRSRYRYRFVEGDLRNISRCYAELKEVEFVGYSGMRGDRELIMHLARNATKLERIVIDPYRPYETRFGRKHAYDCGAIKVDDDARTRANQQLINVMPARIKLDILPPGIMSRFRSDII